jgi:hypothetical protein
MQDTISSGPLSSKDQISKQDTSSSRPLGFEDFSTLIKQFQSLVSKMVLSSFLFSGVISIAQLTNEFKSLGLIPIVTLTGTLSGSAGVFVPGCSTPLTLSWMQTSNWGSRSSPTVCRYRRSTMPPWTPI